MIFPNKNKDQFIFHIPHSAVAIPSYQGYVSKEVLEEEIILRTDWATDIIFEVHGIDSIRANFSRLFCDVERFNSDKEHMNQYGRGVAYTKTENGEELRLKPEMEFILELYNKHHSEFEVMVEKKLKAYKEVFIIDCHTFPHEAIIGEVSSAKLLAERPDICIGFDPENCKESYANPLIKYFENLGFSVAINTPFSGSIVPLRYMGNAQVQSVMIEINRNLYMQDKLIDTASVVKFNRIINGIFGNV